MTSRANHSRAGGLGGWGWRVRAGLLLGLTLFTALGSQARAQNLLDLFRFGCSELGAVAGYEWICRAGDLASEIEETLRTLHEDLVGFGRELFEDWIENALATIAQKTGLGDLGAVFASLEAALAEGPAAFREAVEGAVADLRLSNRAARRGPAELMATLTEGEIDDYGVLYDIAVQTNPNLAAAEGIMDARQDQLLTTRAEAAAVHEQNTQLAERVASSTTMQDAVAQVLEPSLGGLGGGDAARLDDAARTAVSSRAAIQVMTEGIANLMRQQATFSGHLSENLRVLAQQQAMTTWELQLAINALTEQMNAEIARERAEIEAHLAGEYDAGLELAAGLRSVAGGAASSLAPDLDALGFDGLGW